MKYLLFFILIICFTSIQCKKASDGNTITVCYAPIDTTLPAHIRTDYKMVWNDEFDGKEVDTTRWNYRAEGTVRNCATVDRRTIALDWNGHLVISVMKDSAGKYFVGQLGTQNIFETTYGYFECRAMMNTSKGPHIAYWLQSPTMSTVGNPAVNGTEVDIFEYHKMNPDSIYHTIHWNGYGTSHQQVGAKAKVDGIAEGFHSFGLEWTATEYIFYIDGKETWRTSTAVSQRTEYMILSTELTGFGGAPSLGTYPDSVVYDYVRVYKPK